MSKNMNGKGTPKPEAARTDEKNPLQIASPAEQAKELEDVFPAIEQPQNTPPQRTLSIEELQALLKKELEVLNRKKDLADRRDVFLIKRADLVKCKKTVEKDVKGSIFESNGIKLCFKAKGEYDRLDDLFTISNPAIVLKFINVLSDEIDLKVREIEAELLAV